MMQQLFQIVDRIATTENSILITGATGTGKELIARAIHKLSRRAHAPFVDINCSAIPESLFEAECFGHERGSFTGAHEMRRGLFEQASGGTLFLDEVDTLDLAAQAKLLRVLQERKVRRVGGRENIAVDVRVISATNRDLQAAVSEGAFRSDLYFRLRVVPLHMPALCERGDDDVELLLDYFLQRYAARHQLPVRRFTPEAMNVLLTYNWPGNVRELENAVEYSLAISTDAELGVEDLPPNVLERNAGRAATDGSSWLHSDEPLAEIERRYILSTFKRCQGHHIKTAEVLGIDRRTLYRKLRQYSAGAYIRSNGKAV